MDVDNIGWWYCSWYGFIMIYQDKFDHYLTSGQISGSMGELDRLWRVDYYWLWLMNTNMGDLVNWCFDGVDWWVYGCWLVIFLSILMKIMYMMKNMHLIKFWSMGSWWCYCRHFDGDFMCHREDPGRIHGWMFCYQNCYLWIHCHRILGVSHMSRTV